MREVPARWLQGRWVMCAGRTLVLAVGSRLCPPRRLWPRPGRRRLSEPADPRHRPERARRRRDTAARVASEAVEKHLGQRLVIENKPGGSMRIGTSQVAKSPPDGYTLMFSPPAPIVTTEHFPPKLDYDPARDLRPLVIAMWQPLLLIVRPRPGRDDGFRVHRIRQAQPWKDIVRSSGPHRRNAPYAGNPQARSRHRCHAHPLQLRRPGDRRPAGRPARRHVPRHSADQGPCRKRQASRARDLERHGGFSSSRIFRP